MKQVGSSLGAAIDGVGVAVVGDGGASAVGGGGNALGSARRGSQCQDWDRNHQRVASN